MGLKNHYLGENNVDNMLSRAEAKLKDTSYSGEKPRWNFEKYVKTHVDQHAILNGLVEKGYSSIDDQSKVRHLMAGIKTKVMDPVKTQILATPALGTDFQCCVNLFKYFIKQSASDQMTLNANVSQVGTGENYASRRGGDALEDRFYEPVEYDTFSNV